MMFLQSNLGLQENTDVHVAAAEKTTLIILTRLARSWLIQPFHRESGQKFWKFRSNLFAK